jgi:hypothetical protein
LILKDVPEKTALAKLEIKLRHRMRDHKNFQFTMMDITEFNKEVDAGDEYYRYILLNAMLSYDKGYIPFAFPYVTV